MLRILYLTHDLADPTTTKRVAFLLAGGASVTIAGFCRADVPPTTIEGCRAICFGKTYNSRFVQRIASVMRETALLQRHRDLFANTDLIIARNLEMLALGVRGRSLCATPPTLVYESLDIHRLLLREDYIGTSLRALENWLAKRAKALIVSSPAFAHEYYEKRTSIKLPTILLENKVFTADDLPPASTARPHGPPWRIGWFGALRCGKSLDLLAAVARTHPQQVEIILRGRPSYDQLPDFDARMRELPNLHFLGPYTSAELPALYNDVHFSWAIDYFEEGGNSSWLLPNRIYEGCLHGAIPLALADVETGRFIEQQGIGHRFTELTADQLSDFITNLTPEHYQTMQAALATIPRERWFHRREDSQAFVEQLSNLATATTTQPPHKTHFNLEPTPTLIVIPCLNEASHLPALADYLLAENTDLPFMIVIADGGSTDGTVEIAKHLAAAHPNIHYLHNPKRIQSAAINLAVATFGADMHYLIRIDAHADYPKGFCRALLAEADDTGADSVVVSMHTAGHGNFQCAIAAAQNSALGNGGSAHRTRPTHGRWVEHGHHALMRLDAYRAVGGYDETFTHNEDAELDTRLRAAGSRIWLTAATSLTYYPRSSAAALFRQYRNYGKGRARHWLKHRHKLRLRQCLPLAVAPAAALLLVAPIFPLAALPFVAWAGLCLAYGSLIAYRASDNTLALSGPAAMLMHSAWSLGFWEMLLTQKQQLVVRPVAPRPISPPTSIDIAICTFRRAHIATTLQSLAALELPADCTIRIIIADNDTSPSAKALVAATATENNLNVTYIHAPAANISIARNACLDAATADYLAFIDDDETASPQWLSALINRMQDTGADVVLGPVQATYTTGSPDWLTQGDFHSTRPVWVKGEIITGYTGNVLLYRAAPALQNLRFSEALGITGGEDTEFFVRAYAAGASIAYASAAIAYEPVLPERASLYWLIKRRFRYGKTHAISLRADRLRALPLSFCKTAFCMAAALVTLPNPVTTRSWLLRGMLHAGVIDALVRPEHSDAR